MSIHLHSRQQQQAIPSQTAAAPVLSAVQRLPAASPGPGPARRPLLLRILATGLQTSVVVAVLLFATMFGMERLAPPQWKPSTMIGSFGGNQEYAHIATALEAKRAEVAMQFEEQARAQQEIHVMQAANERVTHAYDALFQRGNIRAQQWADMAKQTLEAAFRTRVAAMEGQMRNSATKDQLAMYCDGASIFFRQLGASCQQLRDSAATDRDVMEADLNSFVRRQMEMIATVQANWSQGLADPAELMARQASAREAVLQPQPRTPAPLSPVYPRPAVPLPAQAAM